MKRLIIFFILSIAVSAEADVRVFFEPAEVGIGESTQLIFQSDTAFTQMPDLDSLKKDFVVSGQQQRHSSSWINGVSTAQYELIYNIFPRRQGTLSAGPFTVNGETVKSTTLTVGAIGEAIEEKTSVQISASVSPEVVYPGETAFYTIRITESDGLIDGRITPPVVSDARVTLLDSDKAWQSVENGKNVRIFERTFGIVPEKDGPLAIGEAEFYGIVPVASHYNQRSPFDFFDQGILFNGLASRQKEVLLTTQPMTLQVKSKPADWSGWWLPSQMVDLHVSDNVPERVQVGDPIERTMTLTALGITAEQLPVVVQPIGKGIQVYPSPEKRETIRTPNGDIQGKEVVSVVLVPTQAGSVVIPEVRVPWFNVKTHQREWAVVPAKTVTVVTGDGIPVTSSDQAVPPIINSEPNVPQQPHFADLKEKAPGLYWIMSLIGVGLIIGFLVALLVVSGKNTSVSQKPKRGVQSSIRPQKTSSKKKPIPDLYPF